MNIMRKFMGRGRTAGDDAPTQDNSLGLMHLRRLFMELCHSPTAMSQTEQEDKLYMMLPLFCKVFGNASATEMMEKFGDILQFSSHCGRLMVNEIRRRASNKSTEAASCSIVEYLEIKTVEETSCGWMLLTSLNLLAAGGKEIVDCMTAQSLPSTLVKCLYLFFDLPPVTPDPPLSPETEVTGNESEFTPYERRVLLQKVFVQLLVRLCSHVSPAEELAQKDDLTLLFSAITSWCPPHNVPWRKSAAEVLMTLSRHGLSDPVVNYIHSKQCVALCVDNMQRSQELSPLEIVEMFVTVFCFLKDSSEVSQTLLDDFRSSQGYNFLADFLLRLEQTTQEEAREALRNLVLLVSSLSMCGYLELKPSTANSGAPFQQPGFTVPQPTGQGVTVRNIQAFQVLQTVFLKATSLHLLNTVLDVVYSIYQSDNANYFILEPQNTLSQFAEKLYLKQPEIQLKFFEIIEFIVFNLNYVPCKELISLSILIKSNNSIDSSITAMQSLLKIQAHSTIYKDVYREVGLLDAMVSILNRYAGMLKERMGQPVEEGQSIQPVQVSEEEERLAFLVMDTLVLVLKNNSTNAGVFRECGGARCAHNLVPYMQCRQQALALVQQLVLSSGGDDDMGTILGLMHTAPPSELQLKADILRALLFVLRENHRTRTVFRKVGGFVYVMSVLVSMEGCLAQPPSGEWGKVDPLLVQNLLHTVFHTLTAAMRHEPANAKFFSTEVGYSSLAEAIRLLGCFSLNTELPRDYVDPSTRRQLTPSERQPFSRSFNDEDELLLAVVPQRLLAAYGMFRHLYLMAIDSYDSQAPPSRPTSPSVVATSPVHKRPTRSAPPSPLHRQVPTTPHRSQHSQYNLRTQSPQHGVYGREQPNIVHAGAILAMVDLIPSISSEEHAQLALDLQLHIADIIQWLVKVERNQQVMCNSGLPCHLLKVCNIAFAKEEHLLHQPLQRTYERLASQALEPMDLREFLRLGSPLCCDPWDDKFNQVDQKEEDSQSLVSDNDSVCKANGDLALLSDPRVIKTTPNLLKAGGDAVPLTRVKCLVSMTTPRDVRLHGASVMPAFVEFDMGPEGFGCLYMPNIAPQGPPAASVIGVTSVGGPGDANIVCGIGTGDRLFPPLSGLTFSAWVCIDRYSSPLADPHPVRLLTLVRNILGTDLHYVCLSVNISTRDRNIIVSTQEELLQYIGSEEALEPRNALADVPSVVRFWCPTLADEGQWHHIVLVLNRAVLKNSTAALYVDGKHIGTQKLHYIHNYPGGGSNPNPTAITSTYSYIGTPPDMDGGELEDPEEYGYYGTTQSPWFSVFPKQKQHKPQHQQTLHRHSRLLWRLGPAHMFEDVLANSAIHTIHKLGPNYVGSFQAPHIYGTKADVSGSLIPEDKIMFGVHAHALTALTINKIRKAYNKVDSKAIAKQLALQSHENATPVRIIHNSAGHLSGSARTLGAVLLGYQGVRTFCPRSVASMLENVGGTAALLGLIAMATDVEGLYAAVKALVCVVRSNRRSMENMERTRGYQILANLLKNKKQLLNSHILHLTFSLVGTVDSGRESTIIPNRTAFQDLLCDLEVWHNAPFDLQKSLFEHFIELLTESSENSSNALLMIELGMVSKLLHTLQDRSLSQTTVDSVAMVLALLLQGSLKSSDLLKFGQFLVSTLPTFSVSERNITMENLVEAAMGLPDTSQPDGSSDLSELSESDYSGLVSAKSVRMRNTLLELLYGLLHNSTGQTVNQQFCEEVQRALGFDWLLLFMQGHLHQSTVIIAVRILCVLLSHLATVTKFREGGLGGGGWLDETELIIHNKGAVQLLGFNVGAGPSKSQNREINKEACQLPGFMVLQWLLPKHAHIPELYFILMALLLGQSARKPPKNPQFDLDSIWTYIFGVPASQSAGSITPQQPMCPDAVIVILSMVRAMFNQPWQMEDEGSWLREYPVTLLQFLLFLYHNNPDFVPLCQSPDFLCALAATLFPLTARPYSELVSEPESEMASPAESSEEYKAFAESMVASKSSDSVSTAARGSIPSLTTHPARKFVMDFVRIIIVDSLAHSTNRGTPVVDLVLEASPERATQTQQRDFQTEVLTTLMDHLLAADALLGDQAALPLAAGGSYNALVSNVFHFASRVVDKLWQGIYNKDAKEVFEFIVQLISQAKRRAHGMSLDPIYHCLNRSILYELSRPSSTISEQTAILDALHRLTNNRSLVFGPGNYEQDFIGCLCYCLIQLSSDAGDLCVTMEPGRRTTWHVELPADTWVDVSHHKSCLLDDKAHPPSMQRSNSTSEAQQLLVKAANRIWSELLVTKKATIEELFKLTLPHYNATPDLQSVKMMLLEPASKVWKLYVDGERRNCSKEQEKHQSKLQKMSSGLSRLASRKARRDASQVKIVPSSMQEVNVWNFTHVAVVRDLVELRYKQYQQAQHHMQKYVEEQWNQMELELTRERGLWGPPLGSHLDKWMLEMTEGPCRMRKKLCCNDMFYIHYPHRPDGPNNTQVQSAFPPARCVDTPEFYRRLRLMGKLPPEKPSKYKAAISLDSKEYYKRCQAEGRLEDMESEENGTDTDSQLDASIDVTDADVSKSGLKPSKSPYDADEDDTESTQSTDSTAEETDKPNNQTIVRLLEEGEKIRYMFRCARVQGLDTCEGLLLFGREHFYVIDGFTLLRTREISDIDGIPPGLHDPIIPRTTRSSGQPSQMKRMCSKFAYEDIREVHKRRYLLQPIAIEVFSSDGRNYLLALPRGIRNKVHQRFLSHCAALTDNAKESVSGQKANAKVEQGSTLLSLIGEKTVTQRWERGDISNFQYLMHLNTLAGRSYNDLMQYPVFPWVLADYESEELDLNDPKTFRDLSKPMGAQTEDRLKQFQKRYIDWEDPQGETPPYHYGTHYSSAMIVASYLVRMEPFTQHFLRLQGGHFDLADRMFHSVRDAWMSASKHNMADVKELIPEFFYLPDFLLNKNNFDLGVKQSGIKLGDILLPPWAKGDTREFIRVHREALESDYVSSHLHEWIDLIFGQKQQGEEAIRATNVFHHLFYEGRVDIFSINDPLKKNATIGFINNFGQIPKQLFKKLHPPKRARMFRSVSYNNDGMPVVANNPQDRLFFHNLDNLRPSLQPMKELKGAVGQITATDKAVLAVEQNKVLIPQTYNKYMAWGFADLSIRTGTYESDKASGVYEGLQWGEVLCAACPSARVLITGGTSTVVCVWEMPGKDKTRQLVLKQALYGHTEPVTCLAVSSAYNVIVSGSRDRTCIIWDLNQLIFVRQLRDHAAPVAAVYVNELTGDIATCAGTFLYVWTINGEPIASVNTMTTGRNQQILCVCMSELMEWDVQNVIMTGSSDGVVRMWSVEFVQVPDSDVAQEEERMEAEKTDRGKDTMSGKDAMSVQVVGPVTRTVNDEDLESSNSDDESVTSQDTVTAEEPTKEQKPDDNRRWTGTGKISFGSALPPELVTGAPKSGRDADNNEQNTTASTVDNWSSPEDFVIVTDKDVAEAIKSVKPTKPQEPQKLPETAEVQKTAESQKPAEPQKTAEPQKPTEPQKTAEPQQVTNQRKHSGLRPGFKWQRQLVFRSKLTMHTAYDRRDNHEPAAITALATSKDHTRVFVGDARGRVYSWSVAEQPGRVMTDNWTKDEGVDSCTACGLRFTLTERKHHCRNCGQVFCARCSHYQTEIRSLRITTPVRVCQACYNILTVQHASEALVKTEAAWW
ncbi:WD repeat and FYVE domain-containing protein 3-like isoform X4 [Branchiostoma lanceolatum]|uniref:WD repeat and FYVE domain-containing protein 3-like isoform X4 n=1 Tax=Branchiostoma lanceolatum TaxID=7740 RepID=UPI0034560D69